MSARSLVAVAALGAQFVSAQLSFLRRDLSLKAHSPFGFAGLPRHFSAGDFDNDGSPDLIVVSGAGFTVFLNTGGGNFKATREVTLGMPGPVITADFDGDGNVDLLSAGYWKRDGELFLGQGDGTFAAPRILSNLGWPAAIADFNDDGIIDIACVDRGTTGFGIHLGIGNGTFRRPSQILQGLTPVAMVTGDFDGDSTPDVAARGGLWFGGTGIWVFLARADGTFRHAVDALEGTLTEAPHDALVAEDFDGDGFDDLATEFAIIRGKASDGFHPFHPPVSYVRDPEADSVGSTLAAADFDQNEAMDLVAGSVSGMTNQLAPAGSVISIVTGKDDGAMSEAMQVSTGWGPSHILAVDLDGDDRPDIATLNRVSNTITVLLSRDRVERHLTRAVTSASQTAIVAPGSIATLYARVPEAVPEEASGPDWPEQLGGISLEVRDAAGSSRMASLQSVSDTQINFLVPEETATGEASLMLSCGQASVQIGTLQVEEAAPAVVLVRSWSMTPLAYDIRADEEGHEIAKPTFLCDASGDCEPVPVEPSPSGSTLEFIVTGFRNATVDNVNCAISNLRLDVESVGPLRTRGLQAIRVRVPAENNDFWDLPGGGVHLSIDGIAANMAQMAFRYPSPESRW